MVSSSRRVEYHGRDIKFKAPDLVVVLVVAFSETISISISLTLVNLTCKFKSQLYSIAYTSYLNVPLELVLNFQIFPKNLYNKCEVRLSVNSFILFPSLTTHFPFSLSVIDWGNACHHNDFDRRFVMWKLLLLFVKNL